MQARLAGTRFDRIDVEVLGGGEQRERWQPPGIEVLAGRVVGRIEVQPGDSAALLDMRCCYGLQVLVLAASYADGWPVAQRVADAGPAGLAFCAPDMAVRSNDGGMQAWEM